MKVFISYRRKSWAFTQRLVEGLSQRIEASIFVDYTGIDDDDFEASILSHLRQSDAVLLIVSETTFAPDRINDEKDWVRREIATALTLGKPLVLVAVDGLFPPPADQLPPEIREVAGKQGVAFYPEFFDAALNRLVRFLTKVSPIRLKRRITPLMLMGAGTGLIVLIVVIALLVRFIGGLSGQVSALAQLATNQALELTAAPTQAAVQATVFAQTQAALNTLSVQQTQTQRPNRLATLAAAQTVIAEITQTEAALSSVGGQPSSTPSEDQDLPTAVLPRATPDGNAGSNPDATPATPSLTPTPNRTATARVVSTEDALATAGAWSRGTVAAAATVIAVASIPPSPTLRPTATVLNTVAQFRAPLLSTYRITQEYGANGHKGVDLGAGLGTEVIASSSGQVVSVLRCTKCTPERPNFISQGISGADATAFRAALSDPAWGYGYGNAVIIAYRYGDLPADMRAKLTAQGLAGAQVLVMYAILSEITVEPGAVVGDGTIIGRVGNTGNSTGPHLHLEARLSLDDASAFFSLQAENPRLLFDL